MSAPTIRVRATVNLDGVKAGQIVYVDPTDPYFVDLLRETLLVAEDADVDHALAALVTPLVGEGVDRGPETG